MKTPTKAQAEFLLDLGAAGGGTVNVGDVPVKVLDVCLRAGWITDLTAGAEDAVYSLTWSGWQAMPKMFAEDAAPLASFTAATWSDYADRGLVPPADGYAPHPVNGRAVRFWWSWTVDSWVATERPQGRKAGARQCTHRAPGTEGRTGICRSTIDPATGVCARGHGS